MSIVQLYHYTRDDEDEEQKTPEQMAECFKWQRRFAEAPRKRRRRRRRRK